MAALIAAATLMPDNHIIYGSPWFTVLWGAIAFFSAALMVQRKLWRRPALFAIHAAFIVILAGAWVTSLTSRRGTLHLRQGIPSDMYVQSDGRRAYLPHTVRLDSFQLLTYEGTHAPKDYISYVTLRGRQHRISMNNIAKMQGYRLYQSSYDEDLRGTVLTVNYDPWGTPLTYAGYLLFLAGFLFSLNWKGCLTQFPFLCHCKKKSVLSFGQKCTLTFQIGVLLLLIVDFVGQWYLRGHIPLNSIIDTLLFAGFWLLALEIRPHHSMWQSLRGATLLLMLCLLRYDAPSSPLLPVLRSPWLGIHVGVIMLSYALLVLSFFRRQLLPIAVGLLAVGIFLGAVWANVSWGSYWSWDPKEAWALITLIVYSLPLHTRSLPWFGNERNYRLYSLLAFATLLMTYFGVSYFLGGMHSYN